MRDHIKGPTLYFPDIYLSLDITNILFVQTLSWLRMIQLMGHVKYEGSYKRSHILFPRYLSIFGHYKRTVSPNTVMAKNDPAYGTCQV